VKEQRFYCRKYVNKHITLHGGSIAMVGWFDGVGLSLLLFEL
jgi:hypothetical protein